MYVIQRIDNLGRGATFDVNANSGVYVCPLNGTLATSLLQTKPNNRQSVTVVNPSNLTGMSIVIAPLSAVAADVADTAKYPVFDVIPASTPRSYAIGVGLAVWCRSNTTTTITAASIVEGL